MCIKIIKRARALHRNARMQGVQTIILFTVGHFMHEIKLRCVYIRLCLC